MRFARSRPIIAFLSHPATADALKPDSTKNLLLVPGEPSEMLVKLENAGTRTLELELLLTGNFPNEWYRPWH